MKIYVKKICKFVKTDTVLVVSIVLAVISMLAVKPDRQYLTYIDFRTLAILFCLMTIVAVFRQEGIFDFIADNTMVFSKTGKVGTTTERFPEVGEITSLIKKAGF